MVWGAVSDLWNRSGRDDFTTRLARMTRLPRADWGKATAHAGFGVTLFAVAAMNAWAIEDIRVLKLGESFTIGDYDVQLAAVKGAEGPNYSATVAEMRVTRAGALITTQFPEKRFYPVQGMPTTEAAIHQAFTRDLYLVIGDPQKDGGWAVRAYVKPFADWIWGGALMMALGGVFSLSDRRYRAAAGARRSTPKAVPAE